MHTFDCNSCELPIVVSVRTNAPYAFFEAEENVKLFNEIDETYTVINLHPNFAFTDQNIHNKDIFPSIGYVELVYPHVRKIPNEIHQDIALQFDIPNARSLWAIVRNAITLENNKDKIKVLNKIIKDYEVERNSCIPNTSISNTSDAVFNFFDWLFYPKINKLLEPAINLALKIKTQNPIEFEKFRKFHIEIFHHEQNQQFISIFSDFFKIHTQLGQLMVHVRIGDEDIDNKIVGSKSFEEVKLYYGQAFETLTNSFTTLAALNNINYDRKYNEFKTMNLNKFIKKLDKSKRANTFKNTPDFFSFAENLDSTLRNGSHHASIWRDGEKINYRSGGTGAKRNITYSRYLHLCNKITIDLAAMFLFERKLVNGEI